MAPKDELVRIALAAETPEGTRRAVIDGEGRMGGRGAYLCREQGALRPQPDCLAQAVRRGGIPRALRARVTFDAKLVELMG